MSFDQAEERHRVLVQSREEFGRKMKNIKNTNTEDGNSVILKLDHAKTGSIHLEPLAGIKNNKEKGTVSNYAIFYKIVCTTVVKHETTSLEVMEI